MTWLYLTEGASPTVQNVLKAILLLAALGALITSLAVLAGTQDRLAQILAVLGAIVASAALTITLIWL